ncbi:unnamed protein product [Adineta steineri]|uniref:Phthiocerol/phthiodiolone dimycocerosyl transferase C-terminal domain-containing protein n=1 Tax=Adineta steineri TaxID=433720 RepID=A0A814ZN35_9BILA|nr:unnamed protein product [Adineta steineri]CAF4005442.1 unnamed protein product [Adineta steineri]
MKTKIDEDLSIKNSKQRIMGSAENALILTSQQHHGYMKVGIVMHLQGPYIALQTLITAVNRLQCRHPFLRSRLQVNPEKPGTYLMEEDDTLELKIIEIAREQDDHFDFWRQEWRMREKDPAVVGQGLVQFWLLQDPNDDDDDDSPREIVIVCEHGICDGMSISTVAHELLISLSDNDTNMFDGSLNWPIIMETAVRKSVSAYSRVIKFAKFLLRVLYWRATSSRRTTRMPLIAKDFPLEEMATYCHTEAFYGRLNKEDTQQLLKKCRQEGVTLTSAVSSAILCSTSASLETRKDQSTQLVMAITADTRQRCVPPVPNHDLSYQASGIMAFTVFNKEIPVTSYGMWQLAKTFGNHVKKSIKAGQSLALAMVMGEYFQRNLGAPNMTEHPTCGISNWGRLPFQEKYGNWELLEVTPILNLVRTVMPIVFVQTVNGVLTIACLGSVPIMSSRILERLCNGAMCKLHEMIEDIF